MLTTLVKPTRGTSRCWRRRRGSADAGAAADRYVAQPLSADALLTGHENVELFARLFDVPRWERRERVDAAL